jgi:hypothetical protein
MFFSSTIFSAHFSGCQERTVGNKMAGIPKKGFFPNFVFSSSFFDGQCPKLKNKFTIWSPSFLPAFLSRIFKSSNFEEKMLVFFDSGRVNFGAKYLQLLLDFAQHIHSFEWFDQGFQSAFHWCAWLFLLSSIQQEAEVLNFLTNLKIFIGVNAWV